MIELNGKYANAIVYTDLIDNATITQTIEMLNQPMFKDAQVRIMPDCHAGKGSVIGFTARFPKNTNKIVPNITGVDLGCGVLSLIFSAKNINFEKFDKFINDNIPSGHDIRETIYPKIKINAKDAIDAVCKTLNVDTDYHLKSVGSLGGGNHYIEIGELSRNRYLLTIHTGSRNIGKLTCEHYQKIAEHTNSDERLALIERHKTAITAEEHKAIQYEIEALPKIPKDLTYVRDKDYDDYITDSLLCKTIAAENRRVIAEQLMLYFELNHEGCLMERFDTIHNYVDIEDDYIVIRKGAISAQYGKRLAIPLNMRDGVIIGRGLGNPEWNYSAPHGAGRIMSRSQASAELSMSDFKEAMKNINTWSVCESTLDESPMAYKPADTIINAVKDTIQIDEIAKPVYNYKAH